MGLSGSLEDFSLPELFRIVDAGSKTGCLNVQTLPDPNLVTVPSSTYHIWFQRGQLVAVTHRSDGRGLVRAIEYQGWLSSRVMQKLEHRYRHDRPLGLYLKSAGALSSDQLNLLFRNHMRQLVYLFEVVSGRFEMQLQLPMPWPEMTGISMRATEVALTALRLLDNWQGFAKKLPTSGSALQALVQQPHIPLTPIEWEIWEYARGTVTLATVARNLKRPIEHVQQAAFRLAIAGMVAELPVPLQRSTSVRSNPPVTSATGKSVPSDGPPQARTKSQPKASRSLLANLMNFLRRQL